MRKFLFFFIVILSSCFSDFTKNEHLRTIESPQGIYFEVYKVMTGGALASDSYGYYITDSINFRKHIGVTDYDDRDIVIEIVGDSVFVYKRADSWSTDPDTLEVKSYSIDLLVNEGKWQ